MNGKLYRILAMLMLVSLFLAACQPPAVQKYVETVVVTEKGETIVVTATPDPAALKAEAPKEPAKPVAAEKKAIRMNLGPGDIPTIDPALAQDNNSIQVLEETFVGLTRLEEEKILVVPGLASSWDVSPDGKTYKFHLRDNIPWVKYSANDGKVVKVQDCAGKDRMVTAQDLVYGALRTLAPDTASPYAYVLGFAVQGAADFNAGKSTDPASVGIKALDASTVEITFRNPAAYNLNIAGMWPAYPQPKWLIEGDECTDAKGDRWTETGLYQTYGPYAMKEWVHDSYLTLIKNPFWPVTDEIPMPKIDEITFTMLDDAPAFADYEAGKLDWVLRVPVADMDRVKADPVLSKQMKITPQFSTYFLGFNTKAPIVSDVRVRRALSLAIDRQSIIDNVTKANQEPAQWFCRPGLIGCPTMKTHPDLGVKYNPTEAKKLLDEYLKEKNLKAEDLDLTMMYNTNSSHQKTLEAVQQMWKDNLGVNVKLVNQEWKVYLETTKSKDTPQIFRLSWNLDYPDANNFARENFAKGGNTNPVDESGSVYGGVNWEDPKFEELVVKAAQESDPQKRIELYAEVEKVLVWDDAVIAPIYWFTNNQASKPNVIRTYSNTGAEHVEKWDMQ